ncbi:MAG TPA: PQQ-binding-like beta-propeller repeat protein, partial [Streptosporangiaceae bacterium]|nr:PQQ-binding-like beta-propeller repeat protein [Streptosporangiaceae bacterium]
GHVYALHAASGEVAWSFATTAAPGQPGGGSWAGGSWKLGGGDAWMAPAIDPKLGLIYLAAANPRAQGQGAARAGANLYTSSLVALRWNTGRLAWYFQSVHHDLWDYDNTMSPVIADETYGGTVRKVVIYGSKTGWLYYLDARTGKPALPVHEEPVPQLSAQATAATQPIPAGQSLVPTCPQSTGLTQPVPDYASGCEFTPYQDQPVLVTPGWGGGADWSPMSFDQSTGLLYVAAAEANTAYSTGQPYGQPTTWEPEGERRGGLLDAVNPATGAIAWHVSTADELSYGEGIETTASGLLFEGTPDGLLAARRASTGARLWQWQTGAGISSTPVTYLAHGVQYVAVLAGQRAAPVRLWAFRLGGTVPQAAPPATVPARVPVHGAVVAGDTVADTVVLGRTWDAATHAPSPHENLASPTAMAPEIMTVPAGTTVTFQNPAGNHQDHCAESFFDPASFKIGPIAPGTSGSYQFTKPGNYFYNDCAGFPWNTGEIIVT